MAVLAAQEAAAQKADEAEAGAVHRAADFVGVDVADEVVLVLDLLDVARMHGEIVVRHLALLHPLARDLELVAAAGTGLAHGPPSYMDPWNVRLRTSSCCSLVSLTKFTA